MKNSLTGFFRSLGESIKYYLKGIFHRFMDDDIILYGSAIAFNAIMCLIPLLLLLSALIGMFLNSSTQTFQRINELLNTAFPDQPYANKIKLTIQGIVYGIMVHRKSFGWISLLLLVWTATFMFDGLRTVLNRIFKVQPRKHFFLRNLENIISVIVIMVLFLIANAFFWLSGVLGSFIDKSPDLKEMFANKLPHSFPILITGILVVGIFYIVYQFIPDKRIPVKSALAATFSATGLWLVSGKAFEIYLVKIATFNQLYGTYTFILVFLLWIQYSSIIYIIGAIIGQLHRERREFPQIVVPSNEQNLTEMNPKEG
ncbi:MAG: YihY/virulence factor BrkB family protein [Bacteroidota bacterium]